MIMDTFAALALATEPPHERLLKRPPHNRDDYIVTKRMLKHIGVQAVWQAIILLVLTFYGDGFIPETRANWSAGVLRRVADWGSADTSNAQFWTDFEGRVAKIYNKYNDGTADAPFEDM